MNEGVEDLYNGGVKGTQDLQYLEKEEIFEDGWFYEGTTG